MILGWIFGSVIVGFFGIGRKIGFAGAFLFSLLLSPVVGLIITLFSKTEDADKYEAEILETQRQQAQTLKEIKESAAAPANISDELKKIAELKEQGVISEDEFDRLKAKIIEG